MLDNINTERVHENKFLGVILEHKICLKLDISYPKALLFWVKQDIF